MTHQPHESVADFTHRFSEIQHELDKLISGIHKTAGKEIELIFAAKFRKNSFPENSNVELLIIIINQERMQTSVHQQATLLMTVF